MVGKVSGLWLLDGNRVLDIDIGIVGGFKKM